MSHKKKRRRRRVYTGTVEVVNITPGRRKATKLNFGEEISLKTTEISGSLVSKSSIYDTDEDLTTEKKEMGDFRPVDEG